VCGSRRQLRDRSYGRRVWIRVGDRGRRASWPPPCGVLGYYPNLGVAASLGEASKALGALVVLGTNCGDDCGWRRDHTWPPTATRADPPSETDWLMATGTCAEVEACSAPAEIC
jgi:hypothetical protein